MQTWGWPWKSIQTTKLAPSMYPKHWVGHGYISRTRSCSQVSIQNMEKVTTGFYPKHGGVGHGYLSETRIWFQVSIQNTELDSRIYPKHRAVLGYPSQIRVGRWYLSNTRNWHGYLPNTRRWYGYVPNTRRWYGYVPITRIGTGIYPTHGVDHEYPEPYAHHWHCIITIFFYLLWGNERQEERELGTPLHFVVV